MPALLAWLASAFTKPVLDWIYAKLFNFLHLWTVKRETEKKIAAENKALRENLEKAETKEEKDAAARDLLNRL